MTAFTIASQTHAGRSAVKSWFCIMLSSSGTSGCGFAADELDQMWAFLAGMLYLGNIQFGSGDKVPPDLWNGTEPDAPGWCPRRA